MAADLEEAIRDADRTDVEELFPDLDQAQLDGIARRDVAAFRRSRPSAARAGARDRALPFAVSGSASRKTKAEGTIAAGRRCARNSRKLSASFAPSTT